MHPNVHFSTIYNSLDMEATKMSIERGMDKEDVVKREPSCTVGGNVNV